MLISLVIIPLVAAALVSALAKGRAFATAMLGTLLPVAPMAVLLKNFDWTGGEQYQFGRSWAWFPDLGLNFSIGVNVVGMFLLALAVLLVPICVACSLTAITRRTKTYYFWLLVLQAAMCGVFIARDIILFYTFFEFTLVPMFVLISLYGSTNRKAAAIKFFLYTFTGSVITLAALVYVAWFNATKLGTATDPRVWTFAIDNLRTAAVQMPLETQRWVFVAMMLGFAIKVPVFPFHTWLPLAHTEAPTAGSVVLAGVLLKLGTYGILTFAIPFCPKAAIEMAPFIATLAIIGIVAAGLICWVQTDVKKLVAYSSVSHLGFCILGMFAFNAAGLQGSILYMINHGLSTGALFLLIGMIYERYHTRSMKEIGGLAARMPVWATFMVFFTMASVGLPGLNGFISEFLCLLGCFQSADAWRGLAPHNAAGVPGELGPYFAAVASTGMVVSAIYLLYMVGKVVFGPLNEPHAHDDHADHGHAGDVAAPKLPVDLSRREIGVLVPLAALCLAFGIYPRPLMTALEPAVMLTVREVQTARDQMKLAAGEPSINPVAERTRTAAGSSAPTRQAQHTDQESGQ
ncbi:MAG: complex I subunit 4 family protein [Phycisphaerales bacterium]